MASGAQEGDDNTSSSTMAEGLTSDSNLLIIKLHLFGNVSMPASVADSGLV